MSKTYVLVTNTGTAKHPYSAIHFPSRGLVSKWKGLDKHHDVVFSSAVELGDKLHLHDLEGLYTALALTFGEKHSPAHEMLPMDMARSIYVWTAKRAKPYSEGRNVDTDTDELQEAEADAAAAKRAPSPKSAMPRAVKVPGEPKERSLTHKVYANDQTIKRLLDAPPIASGSNRYRNMETVMASKTVGEALQALKNLTPKGVPADIDLAVAKAAIEIQ
jgi:hypothetical protein